MKIALYAIKKGNNVKQVYEAIQKAIAPDHTVFLEAPHGTLCPADQFRLSEVYTRLTSEYKAAQNKARKGGGVSHFPEWIKQKINDDDATAYTDLLDKEKNEREAAKQDLAGFQKAIVLENSDLSHRTVKLGGATLLTLDDLLPSDEDESKIKAELAKNPTMVWAPGYRENASATPYNELLKETQLGTAPREVPDYVAQKPKLLLTPCQVIANDLDERLKDPCAQDLGLWLDNGKEADFALLIDYDLKSSRCAREWWQLVPAQDQGSLIANFFRGYDAEGNVYNKSSRYLHSKSGQKTTASKPAGTRVSKPASQKLCPHNKHKNPPKRREPPKTPPKIIPPKVDLPECPNRYDDARTLNIPFNFGTAVSLIGDVTQVGISTIGSENAYKAKPGDVKLAFGLVKEALQTVLKRI